MYVLVLFVLCFGGCVDCVVDCVVYVGIDGFVLVEQLLVFFDGFGLVGWGIKKCFVIVVVVQSCMKVLKCCVYVYRVRDDLVVYEDLVV